jgi:hypothetical protein
MKKNKLLTIIIITAVTFVGADTLICENLFSKESQYERDTIEIKSEKYYFSMQTLIDSLFWEINKFLPTEKRTKELNVIQIDSNSYYYCPYQAIYEPYPVPIIRTTNFIMEDSILLPLTIFHEQAHAFYDFIGIGQFQDTLKFLYKKASAIKVLKTIPKYCTCKHPKTKGYPRYIICSRCGKFFRTRENIYEKYIDINHPVFSLFDESNYYTKLPWEWGHLYSDATELFASASSVLRYFCDEFINRLLKCFLNDKEYFKLSASIAVTILNCWNDYGIYDSEMYNKLMNIIEVYNN